MGASSLGDFVFKIKVLRNGIFGILRQSECAKMSYFFNLGDSTEPPEPSLDLSQHPRFVSLFDIPLYTPLVHFKGGLLFS